MEFKLFLLALARWQMENALVFHKHEYQFSRANRDFCRSLNQNSRFVELLLMSKRWLCEFNFRYLSLWSIKPIAKHKTDVISAGKTHTGGGKKIRAGHFYLYVKPTLDKSNVGKPFYIISFLFPKKGILDFPIFVVDNVVFCESYAAVFCNRRLNCCRRIWLINTSVSHVEFMASYILNIVTYKRTVIMNYG